MKKEIECQQKQIYELQEELFTSSKNSYQKLFTDSTNCYLTVDDAIQFHTKRITELKGEKTIQKEFDSEIEMDFYINDKLYEIDHLLNTLDNGKIDQNWPTKMKLDDLIERISILVHIERIDNSIITKQILEDSSKITDPSLRVSYLESAVNKIAKMKVYSDAQMMQQKTAPNSAVMAELKRRCSNQEKENQELKEKLTKSENISQSMQNKYETCRIYSSKLESLLEKKNIILEESIKEELSQLASKTSTFSKEIKILHKKLDESNRIIGDKAIEISELKNVNEVLKEENRLLKNSVKPKDKNKIDDKLRVIELTNEVNKLKEKLQSIEAPLNKRISFLTSKANQYKKELENCQINLADSTRENNEFKFEIDNMKSKFKHLEDEFNSVNEINLNSQKLNNDLSMKINELERENELKNLKLSELESNLLKKAENDRNLNLENENKLIESNQINELQKKQIDSLSKENENLALDVESKNKQISSLEQEKAETLGIERRT